MPTVSARALAALPAVIVGVVVFLVLVFVDPVIAIVAGLVVGGVVVFAVEATATGRALAALGGVPIEEGSEPRLESLVESVCAGHGINEPGLYLAKTAAVDAAVVGRSDDTRLVVTRGLLDELDRLELEAVVARELSMFGTGVQASTVLASVGGLLGPLGGALRERLLDDRRFVAADFDAVGVTRYPPALAAAFEKAAAVDRVPHNAAADHLWMVGSGTDSVQPELSERVDGLLEL